MDSQNCTLSGALASAARTCWRDEEGFVITIELILIATIVGIGSIVGLTTLRNAINSELADVSDAIQAMEWGDSEDETAAGSATAVDTCITFTLAPTDEA